MIKVFLANQGAYNRGELHGEWVTLPTSEEELNEVIERVLTSSATKDLVPDEDTFIADYESEFFDRVPEYAGVWTLNAQAERLETYVNEYGEDVVKAVIGDLASIEDAFITIEEGNFSILFDVRDEYDLGLAYVQDGLFGDIPEDVERYFDYEALGRDLIYEGWTIRSDLGIAIYIY